MHIIGDYIRKFQEIRSLAEKSVARLSDKELLFVPAEGSLSVLAIMHHLGGNMISRWTGFPEEDGEKQDRNRDQEFEEGIFPVFQIKEIWNKGWTELFTSLGRLEDSHLSNSTFIRSEEMSIHQAILRQMSHLSYHTGQIVFLAKMIKAGNWESLSIPKGQSESYNRGMKAKLKKDSED